MALVISVQPTQEPIELSEAKNHLKVEIDDDDALIQGMIKAAREYAEAATGRALLTQTWKMYLDEWPDGDCIKLPLPPLQSVSSIKYTDINLTITTWASSEYTVDANKEPGEVVLSYGYSWPTATLNVTSPIEIEYVCGYGTPDDVPEAIKLGMKVHLGDLYENREATIISHIVEELPTIHRLYYPYRTFDF